MLIPRILTPQGVALNVSVDDARAMGASEADIASALAALRRDAVKAECRRRIYAVASAETQLNMTSYVTAIGLKPAAARSDVEKAAAASFLLALEWVEAMRAAVAAIAADLDVDMTAQASWPACPAEVSALADRF